MNLKNFVLMLFGFGVLFIFGFGVLVGEESGVAVSAKPRLVQGSLTTVTPMIDLTFNPAIDPIKALQPRGIPAANQIVSPKDVLTHSTLSYATTFNRAHLTEVINVLESLPPVTDDKKVLETVMSDPVLHRDYWARNVRFSRDVWCLQFSFKPLRVITVDIPNTEGTLDKKVVWYLVYNVKNNGPADIASVLKKHKTVDKTTAKTDNKPAESNIDPAADDGADNNAATAATTTATATTAAAKLKNNTTIPEYTINKYGSIGTEVDVPTKGNSPQIKDVQNKYQLEYLPDADKGDVVNETYKLTGDTYMDLMNLKGTYVPRAGEDRAIRFIPQFLLASDRVVLNVLSGIDPQSGQAVSKTEIDKQIYVDRFLPLAIPLIMRREGMSAVPENSVSISSKELKSGEDYWGVAMWVDVDPRINKFSIYVNGLTNAYKWDDIDEKNIEPGKGRKMFRKVLKTNWWRKGDRYSIDNNQFQLGESGGVDYEWIFL
jgi:hypothetical protein